jgi:hypothetical protein
VSLYARHEYIAIYENKESGSDCGFETEQRFELSPDGTVTVTKVTGGLCIRHPIQGYPDNPQP